MTREGQRRGMRARARHYAKVRGITEEEAIQNFKDRQRRLAEKMGWNDRWHKRALLKSHKSRTKHTGHGR